MKTKLENLTKAVALIMIAKDYMASAIENDLDDASRIIDAVEGLEMVQEILDSAATKENNKKN
jgi:hypothetical protein